MANLNLRRSIARHQVRAQRHPKSPKPEDVMKQILTETREICTTLADGRKVCKR